MFSNLAKFETVRSGKAAFGFYISYLLLAILVGGVIGGIAGVLNPDNAQQIGLRAGSISSVLLCCSLAVAISAKKGLFSSFKIFLLIAVAGVLSLLLGAFGGLIPVAYLTTLRGEQA